LFNHKENDLLAFSKGANRVLTMILNSEAGRLAEPSEVASARRPYQKLICALLQNLRVLRALRGELF
jgi:hypothetical protein